MLAGQAINVKRDIHLMRKRGDDVFAHCAPCGAIELTIAHALIEERGDAALGILNELRFALAEISNSHLHQLLDAGQTRHHIVKDAGVAPRETFERITQVRVRVNLQNAHAWMAQREFSNQSERAGVVAAEHRWNGTAVQDALGFARNVTVHAFARCVHCCERLRVGLCFRLVAWHRAANLDDGLGHSARLL